MAVSKNDVVNNLNEADKHEVAALEGKIDDWLRSQSRNPPYYYNVPYSLSEKVRAEIERRYRAAGWDVQYTSDQRDGNFWRFA